MVCEVKQIRMFECAKQPRIGKLEIFEGIDFGGEKMNKQVEAMSYQTDFRCFLIITSHAASRHSYAPDPK